MELTTKENATHRVVDGFGFHYFRKSPALHWRDVRKNLPDDMGKRNVQVLATDGLWHTFPR